MRFFSDESIESIASPNGWRPCLPIVGRHRKFSTRQSTCCVNKELKNAMLGDRMSCHAFAANQFRLLEHVTAYILMYLMREHLADTALANVQMDTLRLRLLKVAAVVRITARRVWLELSASHPSASLWPRLVPLLQ